MEDIEIGVKICFFTRSILSFLPVSFVEENGCNDAVRLRMITPLTGPYQD